MNSEPSVTVLLPVHNGAGRVARAVESVLAQSWRDFELLVLDDGSTDATSQVLDGFHDERLVRVRHDNMGLARTLNRGLAMARGRYVARLDHDDVAHPDRLRQQVERIEMADQPAVVGTWASIVNEDMQPLGSHRHPIDARCIRFLMLFDNPLVHSSVLFRRDLVLDLGGYPERQGAFPEDYALWSTIVRAYPVVNLPHVLTTYVESVQGVSRVRAAELHRHAAAISTENLVVDGGASRVAARAAAALWHRTPDTVDFPSSIAALRCVGVAAARMRDPRSGLGADIDRLSAAVRRSLLARTVERRAPRSIELARRTLRAWKSVSSGRAS